MDSLIDELQKKLQIKTKELNIILELDKIRDKFNSDPDRLTKEIVKLIQKEMEAKFCALIVDNKESNQAEIRAYTQVDDNLIDYKSIFKEDIAKKAVSLQDLSIWNTKDLIKDRVIDALQVVTVPLKINKEPIGALLVGRKKSFESEEKRVIDSAKNMIDSAIIQCQHYNLLQQKLKELQTIYKIDKIRDKNLPFDEMLEEVLIELTKILDSQIGFIMLYDNSGKKLELKAITKEALSKEFYKEIESISYSAINQEGLIQKDNISKELNSILALPLILNEQIIGVLGVINPKKKATFANSDKSLLQAIGSQIDTAIFESIEKRRLRVVLERAVDPKIMNKILQNSTPDILLGERVHLTVLYADLRDSTKFSQEVEPEILVKFINEFYERMSDVIFSFDGTLDKFIGDEVMALFGAPLYYKEHPKKAIECAIAMQREYKNLQKKWSHLKTPGLGIGVATGEMIAGEMGSSKRSHYTVIGKSANLGSRVCSLAKAKEILISFDTYTFIKNSFNCSFAGEFQLKGISQKEKIYKIEFSY